MEFHSGTPHSVPVPKVSFWRQLLTTYFPPPDSRWTSYANFLSPQLASMHSTKFGQVYSPLLKLACRRYGKNLLHTPMFFRALDWTRKKFTSAEKDKFFGTNSRYTHIHTCTYTHRNTQAHIHTHIQDIVTFSTQTLQVFRFCALCSLLFELLRSECILEEIIKHMTLMFDTDRAIVRVCVFVC